LAKSDFFGGGAARTSVEPVAGIRSDQWRLLGLVGVSGLSRVFAGHSRALPGYGPGFAEF
jgi:hypothetical protein